MHVIFNDRRQVGQSLPVSYNGDSQHVRRIRLECRILRGLLSRADGIVIFAAGLSERNLDVVHCRVTGDSNFVFVLRRSAESDH